MSDPRHVLGIRGEEVAARWLRSSGWSVLARRWRSPHGELDLVCRDPGGALVAVEVKLRSSPRTGTPAESLDARRVLRLRRSLVAYATQHHTEGSGLRVDLVTLIRDGSRWRLRHHRAVDGW